jgi:prepilin-type N-terminal cleavage/methylation domain-containing protein
VTYVSRARADGGFTLVEILMVILIACILLAIAMPAFLGQKEKATDARAKSDARTAETAMQVYRTDHDGSYACGTSAECVTELHGIERAVPTAGLAVSDEDGAGSAGLAAFRVTALGGAGREFWISRRDGDRSQGCAVNSAPSPGGCRVAAGGTDGQW